MSPKCQNWITQYAQTKLIVYGIMFTIPCAAQSLNVETTEVQIVPVLLKPIICRIPKVMSH